jgi:hypothetical protein
MILAKPCPLYSDGTAITPGDELLVYYPDLHGIPHRGLVYRLIEASPGVFVIEIAHSSKQGGVCIVTFENFAQGQAVQLRRRPFSAEHASQIVERAASAFGYPYNALTSNCEHFTDWCYNGVVGESSTLQAGILVSSLVVLGMAALAEDRD